MGRKGRPTPTVAQLQPDPKSRRNRFFIIRLRFFSATSCSSPRAWPSGVKYLRCRSRNLTLIPTNSCRPAKLPAKREMRIECTEWRRATVRCARMNVPEVRACVGGPAPLHYTIHTRMRTLVTQLLMGATARGERRTRSEMKVTFWFYFRVRSCYKCSC